MLIDWFTVGAQALNFVVLVWLMKRFLYRPIRHAIEAREGRITAELADADVRKAEATKEREEFQEKNTRFDEQRAARFSQMTSEVKGEHQRLLGEAQEEARVLQAKHKETLRTDARDLSQALQRRTREEVFAITKRALTDLATTSLEARMSEVFTRRLRELEPQEKTSLGKALLELAEPAVVRSAFELPDEERTVIRTAINETFSADISLSFETAPDLVSGVELSTTGLTVGWSISGYLASMEEQVAELLEEKNQKEPQAKNSAASHGT